VKKMDADSFKREIEKCDWLFDLFAIGYDFIATRVTPSLDLDSQYPDLPSAIMELSRLRLAELLVSADGGVPSETTDFLRPAASWTHVPPTELEREPFLTRLLALLRLIDQVSAGVSDFSYGLSPREWPGVRTFLRSHHHVLSKNPHRGVILKPPPLGTMDWWRLAVAAGDQGPLKRGQFHHRLFQNLLRLPESLDHDLKHIVLRSADDAEQGIRGNLRVGVIPLVQNMDVNATGAALIPGPLRIVDKPPLNFAVEVDGAGDPVGAYSRMFADLDRALTALCDLETHIILLPELVVPDAVLERVKDLLRSRSIKGSPTPSLVLAGTFGRPDAANGKIYNEAVILNGRGTELFRQRKMHAYTMHRHEQPKYELNKVFGGQPRTELMEIMPRVLVVCDSPVLGLRINVLICEDFCQQAPGLESVRKLHSSLVLSPVMAGALDKDSGFYQTASQLALDPECLVVVANSRALPSKQPCASTASCSLGIFASPLYDPSSGMVHLLTAQDPRGFLHHGTIG
jgi:predicted amidohydrolase